MNYGFYDFFCNGKLGKFFEEERLFVDYFLSGFFLVFEVSVRSKYSFGVSLFVRIFGFYVIIFYKLIFFSENCSLYRFM